ncbi:MAG TPA: class I SAM-dependent methyltransferase [bacterium]|nr:class I SAM-dependent methyltransferase [bacterium]
MAQPTPLQAHRIDWSVTSADYAEHRPGPPLSYYRRLQALGVGLPGQSLLDLGTGTGLVARQLARQGARVTGVDVAEGQIAAARREAEAEGLAVEFRVAPAEQIPFEAASFDAIVANQSWWWFDVPRASAEATRLLKPGGVLVVSQFNWLVRHDPVAKASEQLVLQFNPTFDRAAWHGRVRPFPAWAEGLFTLQAMFWYDEAVPFTRDSWRGRLRASYPVAALGPEGVARFDQAHEELLQRIAPERFGVVHRIVAHLLLPGTDPW